MKYIVIISLVIAFIAGIGCMQYRPSQRDPRKITKNEQSETEKKYIVVKDNGAIKELISRSQDTLNLPNEEDFIAVDKEAVVDLEELSRLIVYPVQARMNDIEGKVIVRVLINTNGLPVRAKIYQTVDPVLNVSALRAVMKMAYEPARKNGKGVPVWILVPIMYTLK